MMKITPVSEQMYDMCKISANLATYTSCVRNAAEAKSGFEEMNFLSILVAYSTYLGTWSWLGQYLAQPEAVDEDRGEVVLVGANPHADDLEQRGVDNIPLRARRVSGDWSSDDFRGPGIQNCFSSSGAKSRLSLLVTRYSGFL